jgi:hypothetical protein
MNDKIERIKRTQKELENRLRVAYTKMIEATAAVEVFGQTIVLLLDKIGDIPDDLVDRMMTDIEGFGNG